MKKICQRYGDVYNILERKQNPVTNSKLFYLIEYTTLEEAKRAYKAFCEKKTRVERDGKCEIAILLNADKLI